MEFWGIEVKSGQPLDVKLGEDKVLHLSQACLGELKKDKANESVCLYVTVAEKKLVLGTLHSERLPQQLFDLVFDKDFQLSHNWKNGSVYFYGYKADNPADENQDSEELDTEDEEDLSLAMANGKQEPKKEEKPAVVDKNSAAKGSAAGKQKVKIVEPEKEKKAGESDSDSDDSDDSSMSDGSDSDEDNKDSSDDDDDDDSEEEETPKKKQSGKKRPNEAAVKTPGTDKKAKLATPQKTDGKKSTGGHVATPHPSKQAAKTPANKSNQKSPASASEGAHSCKSCNRNFKSDMALKSHNEAKHK